VAQQPDQLTSDLIRKGQARGGDPDAVVRRDDAPPGQRGLSVLASRPPATNVALKALGARIRVDLHERLDSAAFFTRTSKQDLVSQMIEVGLDRLEVEIRRRSSR
jgi:hypothetical protein